MMTAPNDAKSQSTDVNACVSIEILLQSTVLLFGRYKNAPKLQTPVSPQLHLSSSSSKPLSVRNSTSFLRLRFPLRHGLPSSPSTAHFPGGGLLHCANMRQRPGSVSFPHCHAFHPSNPYNPCSLPRRCNTPHHSHHSSPHRVSASSHNLPSGCSSTSSSAYSYRPSSDHATACYSSPDPSARPIPSLASAHIAAPGGRAHLSAPRRPAARSASVPALAASAGAGPCSCSQQEEDEEEDEEEDCRSGAGSRSRQPASSAYGSARTVCGHWRTRYMRFPSSSLIPYISADTRKDFWSKNNGVERLLGMKTALGSLIGGWAAYFLLGIAA
ncbi:hypothetical protein ACLOJK_038216 [Asimina triloba]